MVTPTCPITGEPLLNPGQTVSHTAINRLQTQTRGLAAFMGDVTQALAGHHSDQGRRGTAPTSTPPINVALLDRIDEHRDTIMIWAANLAAHVNPHLRFRNGDWPFVEAIYQQLAAHATTWAHAPNLIDEVLGALHQLERSITPQHTPQLNEHEKTYAIGALINRRLTINAACEAVRLISGQPLPKNTIYTWVARGKLKPEGDPKRYLIRDLLNLQDNT